MRQHPRTIHPVQRVNHFPNMKQLYSKDCLASNMALVFEAAGPAVPQIAPPSWCMPRQMPQLTEHLRASGDRGEAGEARPVYIVKPSGGLQGRGIRLTSDPLSDERVVAGQNMVVQHYVDPPLLLDGFKFDLRLYVLILSVDPLKVHVYNDGLVRLCTTPYKSPDTSKSMSDRNAHLTNYSLNKKSKNFVKGPDGSKRSLKDTFAALKDRGIDVDQLWTSTIDVINSAVLSVHPKLRKAYRTVVPKGSTLHLPTSTCYEILGVDVMYDSSLKPWLIEVNHAPSFRGGSKIDSRIKAGVMRQALQLLRVSTNRKKILQSRCRKEWERYMFDQAGCKPASPTRAKRASSARTSRSTPRASAPPDFATSDPELAALMEMCDDGEFCPVEQTIVEADGQAHPGACDDASGDTGPGSSSDDGPGDASPPPDGGEEPVDDGTDDTVDENVSAVNQDESDEEEPIEPVRHTAPLPGCPDEFIKIFSGLSKRNRAEHARIIAAAEEVFKRDAADSTEKLPMASVPRTSQARRHSEPIARRRRTLSGSSHPE